MKKFLLSSLLSISLGMGGFQKPADAAVGVAFGAIPLAVMGGLCIAVFVPVLGVVASNPSSSSTSLVNTSFNNLNLINTVTNGDQYAFGHGGGMGHHSGGFGNGFGRGFGTGLGYGLGSSWGGGYGGYGYGYGYGRGYGYGYGGPYVSVNSDSYAIFLSSFMIVAGIIMLDEQGDFQFSKLTAENAKNMNVPTEAMNIYNSELDELNAIRENVTQDLNGSTDVKKAKELWESYASKLSSETLAVAQTIAGGGSQAEQ